MDIPFIFTIATKLFWRVTVGTATPADTSRPNLQTSQDDASPAHEIFIQRIFWTRDLDTKLSQYRRRNVRRFSIILYMLLSLWREQEELPRSKFQVRRLQPLPSDFGYLRPPGSVCLKTELRTGEPNVSPTRCLVDPWYDRSYWTRKSAWALMRTLCCFNKAIANRWTVCCSR